jgi:hypothetical protein
LCSRRRSSEYRRDASIYRPAKFIGHHIDCGLFRHQMDCFVALLLAMTELIPRHDPHTRHDGQLIPRHNPLDQLAGGETRHCEHSEAIHLS